MIEKFRKFTALDGRQRRLFIEAYIILGVMRASILAIPFKQMVKSMVQQKHAVAPLLNCIQLDSAKAIGNAVQSAAGNTPWESTCLVQVLTAQRMLSKRDIGGIFHLGATMDGNAEERLKAHAWLLCDNHIIIGEAGYEQYTVLSTYSWKVK